MTTKNTTPELPDDPRDCCRAAHRTMGDDFVDAETTVRDMLAVTFSAIPDLVGVHDSYAAELLRRSIGRGQDAMDRLSADLDKVQALVRHGMVDCRRSDAIIEARGRALEEGRDPNAAGEEAASAYDAQQEGRA